MRLKRKKRCLFTLTGVWVYIWKEHFFAEVATKPIGRVRINKTFIFCPERDPRVKIWFLKTNSAVALEWTDLRNVLEIPLLWPNSPMKFRQCLKWITLASCNTQVYHTVFQLLFILSATLFRNFKNLVQGWLLFTYSVHLMIIGDKLWPRVFSFNRNVWISKYHFES